MNHHMKDPFMLRECFPSYNIEHLLLVASKIMNTTASVGRSLSSK